MTLRQEANAIVCWAFRNGFLEELHAGEYSNLLENPSLSRISSVEMKRLMIECCVKMTHILRLRDENPTEYERQVEFFTRPTRKTGSLNEHHPACRLTLSHRMEIHRLSDTPQEA